MNKEISYNGWLISACFLTLWGILLTPLLSVQHPQAIDLINHLARQYVRAQIPVNQVLSNIYVFKWIIVPDLAIDLFVAPLQHFFSIYDCGRILIAMIITLWSLAPLVLHRALWGRWNLWPLLALMVVYNGNLTWGFAAYLLTSACAVIAFSSWVLTEKFSSIIRLTIFAPIAFGLYCGHLIAFGIFGVLVSCYELTRLIEANRLSAREMVNTLVFLLPLFLPEILHFLYLNIVLPPAHGTHTVMFSWPDRLMTLLSPFVDGVTTAGDEVHTQVAIFNMLFLGCVVGWLALNGKIKLHSRMLIAILILFFVAGIMPPKFIGVSFTHLRLPFVVLSLFLASIKVEKINQWSGVAISAVFAALIFTRVEQIKTNWMIYDRQSEEFITKTSRIKPGDKVLVTNNRYPASYVEHYHTASLLVIENNAFIPNLFSGTHVFHAKGDYLRLSPATATHPLNAALLQIALEGKNPKLYEPDYSYWKTWWKDYDYVVAYQPSGEKNFYPKQLDIVTEGSFFTLYKVKK